MKQHINTIAPATVLVTNFLEPCVCLSGMVRQGNGFCTLQDVLSNVDYILRELFLGSFVEAEEERDYDHCQSDSERTQH
jgi:hypothetical protein